MKVLETVEISIDGNLGRINKQDFDPEIHTLWEEEVEEVEETEDDDDDAKDEGKDGNAELTLPELVPPISTWAEIQTFIETHELDFKAVKGECSLKEAKTALLEFLVKGEEE